MKKVIVLLAIIVSLFSYQKDKETISDLIVGKWEWVKTESPWIGLVSNPQTAGYSITLEFTGDGNLKEYKNDTLTTSTNYSIEINSTDPNKNMLIYDTEIRTQIAIVKDSLILNSAYVDGPVSTYIRLK